MVAAATLPAAEPGRAPALPRRALGPGLRAPRRDPDTLQALLRSPAVAVDIAAWRRVRVGGRGWGRGARARLGPPEAGLLSSAGALKPGGVRGVSSRAPARPRVPPHLVVKPEVLHVHAQEPGVHVERPHLASRRDVEDDISEATRPRIQDRAVGPFQGHGAPLPPTLLARQRRASPAVSLPLTAHLPSAARSRPSPQEASPASSALGCLEPWQTRPAAETSAAGVPAPSPRQLPQGGAHASPLPWGGPEPRPQRSPGAAASPLPPQPPPCEDRGTRTERRAGLRSPAAPPCPGAGRPCSGGPAASSLSRSS